MGFSTSGAAAIMLIAFLVAASVIFPTVFTAGSETGDAFAAQTDQSRDQANTDIDVTSAEQEYEDAYGTLTVTVANDGTNALDVSDTDLLLEGEFVAQTENALETTVIVDTNGDEQRREDTNIWPPSSSLEFEVGEDLIDDEFGTDESIDRVLVVTETGVSDATEEIETEETA